MEYQIVWTQPALADVDAITDYIARRNPSAAEKMRATILEHVEILGTFPLIGPVYPRDRRGLIREIVCKKYRIFYRVIEASKRVEILTVWHGSRQEPDLPP
jgi:addiction module RelE/StbE family toxin